jgi:transcriptional regulator with XRE-family HTH domain
VNAVDIGKAIKQERKRLSVTAKALSGASGISRVTLHRIEKGEGASSLNSYLAVVDALNLEFTLTENVKNENRQLNQEDFIPVVVRLEDYPELKKISWHITGRDYLKPFEAHAMYERNARHLDENSMTKREQLLMANLNRAFT